MNKYEYINDKENISIVVKLIRNGFMNPTVVRDLRIYDRFHELDGSKGDRYKKLSEEFRIAPITVQLIIINLNKPAK